MLENNKFDDNKASIDIELISFFLTHCQNKRNKNDNAAIICEEFEITFEKIDLLSNIFSNYLKSKSIKKGALVGICLDRNIDMLAAVLGVLKAGAAYIPLDPAFPAARLQYMVQDSGLDAIITQKEYLSLYKDRQSYQTILIDSERQQILTESDESPELEIDPESLAYVIYTSGSTGNPKGVQIQHKALLNFLLSMQKKTRYYEGRQSTCPYHLVLRHIRSGTLSPPYNRRNHSTCIFRNSKRRK